MGSAGGFRARFTIPEPGTYRAKASFSASDLLKGSARSHADTTPLPRLSSGSAGRFVKLLYIGDSSTGKTGSLVSLVKAGYRLKILDLDNGLDVLRSFVKNEAPDKIDLVDYETIRDSIRPGNQGPIVSARAFVEGTKLMTKWSDDSIPAEGGESEDQV